jgi:hypothetical protein
MNSFGDVPEGDGEQSPGDARAPQEAGTLVAEAERAGGSRDQGNVRGGGDRKKEGVGAIERDAARRRS